jgi:HEPN domain-containing protein
MSVPLDPAAWVRWANEDYRLAIIALRRAQPLTYGACFHAQQAAEKYLKAVLVAEGIVFPRTHDLGALVTLLSDHGTGLGTLSLELQVLSGHVVEVRYPGVMPMPDDARRAVPIAARARRACLCLLAQAGSKATTGEPP